MMQFMDAQKDQNCTPGSYSKDLPSHQGVTLAALAYTCTAGGQKSFLGFIIFIDESQKVGQLFWLRATGPGVTDAVGQAALDRLYDALQKKYVG
jgi:hypothetical protein